MSKMSMNDWIDSETYVQQVAGHDRLKYVQFEMAIGSPHCNCHMIAHNLEKEKGSISKVS